MTDLYDELDSSGNTVRTSFVIGPYDTLAEGHTWKLHEVTLAELKLKRRQDIEVWRDLVCITNISTSINGASYNWQADNRSQQLISQAITLAEASAIPAPVVWRSADNQDVPINLQDLKTMAATMALQTSQAYSHSWDLKKQLDAATTVDEVNSIVW